MTVTALHPAQPPVPQPFPAPTVTADIVYEPAPAGAPTDAPRVFAAINGVMKDAMPVGKDQTNTHQNYKFRGIDDVMSAMAGPMRTHGVFILPSIAAQKQERDGKITRTLIKMRYRIYGPAGDCLVAEIPGESFDTADKSMNKAQAAALKYLLFTLFMLPVDGRSIDDGDRDHPQPSEEHRAERQQRGQQRQQRGQRQNNGQSQGRQNRPNNSAEPGTNEQPQRNYIAEAMENAGRDEATQKEIRGAAHRAGAPDGLLSMLDDIEAAFLAPNAEGVRALHKKAKAGGAPADHLARIATIGATKPGAKAPGRAPSPDLTKDAGATAEAAEQRLRLAASRAGLVTVDADFEHAYGLPIDQAPAAQLHAMADMIEKADQR